MGFTFHPIITIFFQRALREAARFGFLFSLLVCNIAILHQSAHAAALTELKMEPSYISDNVYRYRPILSPNRPPNFTETSVEVSEDGQQWQNHPRFIPEKVGVYYVRARGVLVDGSVQYSGIGRWRPHEEHFMKLAKKAMGPRTRLSKVKNLKKNSAPKIEQTQDPSLEGSSIATETPTEPSAETPILTPESPGAVAAELPYLENPLSYELGLGGSYLSMMTESDLSEASSTGFSGPGVYLALEKQYNDMALKFSFLNVHSDMKITNGTQTTSQSLDWMSLGAAIQVDPLVSLPRLEFGFSYQQVPLIYQNLTNQNGQFGNGSTVFATAGFLAKGNIADSGFVFWDQRLLIPIASNGNGDISSLQSKIGTEGSIGYFYCLPNKWSVGGVVIGQLTQTDFTLPAQGALQADSPQSTSFNSNFQIRLRNGSCL